ncbi:MAG: heme-copper oxidase subunit III [Flavobacteriales bacterium]|nr:heme-copper oxidase subunit III [Flavobacteriales bacterium]MBP9080582.1 heme-copper oxidase subunit III [Flavobacteriales bacterium]
MTAAEQTPEQQGRINKAKKNIAYFFYFAIIMFFAGLSSAYLVSMGGANYWVRFRLPAPFWWSTAFIVVSSATVQMALIQARKNNKRAVVPWVLATLVLGACFTASQFKGWNELLHDGYALVSRFKSLQGEYGTDYTIERRGIPLVKSGEQYFLPEDAGFAHPLNAEMEESLNTASSYFHVITYAHFAHVIGGLIALVVMSIKAGLGRYGAQAHQGLWAGTWYWHFLAGLWVYLLLFLVYVH